MVKYLSNHFTLNNKTTHHTCDICNIYMSTTLKGIAAHKKGCKKKMSKNTILEQTS